MDCSVVVTVYNIEDYIAECLDSILEQQEVSIEVICVDDCSTDKSSEILKHYAESDKRVKVFRTEINCGLASARNMGIRLSQGKYIYNIDGDDKLADGALKTMIQYMDKFSLDMLSFSAYSFFEDEDLRQYGDENEYIRKHEYPGIWDGKELFAKLVEDGERVNGNTVLYCFNSSFFKDNNLYLPEGVRYCDDRMFSAFIKAQRVMCINDPLYLRRYRRGSAVTSSMKKIYLESMILCFVAEQVLWREVFDKTTKEVNKQIESYFDKRASEIESFENMFKEDKSAMELLSQHPMELYLYNRIFKKKSIYSYMLSSSDMEKIKKCKLLYVYGMGFVSRKIVDILDKLEIENYSFVVTKKELDSFAGKRVYGIDEICDDATPLFIVAVSEKYQNEIVEILMNRGFDNYCLIKEG